MDGKFGDGFALSEATLPAIGRAFDEGRLTAERLCRDHAREAGAPARLGRVRREAAGGHAAVAGGGPLTSPKKELRADLCVYSGSPAGLSCAIRAAREGLSVVVVPYTPHLGGVLTSGLCVWDTQWEGPPCAHLRRVAAGAAGLLRQHLRPPLAAVPGGAARTAWLLQRQLRAAGGTRCNRGAGGVGDAHPRAAQRHSASRVHRGRAHRRGRLRAARRRPRAYR